MLLKIEGLNLNLEFLNIKIYEKYDFNLIIHYFDEFYEILKFFKILMKNSKSSFNFTYDTRFKSKKNLEFISLYSET